MFFHKFTAKIPVFFIMVLFPVLLPVFTFSNSSPFVKWSFPFQALFLAVFAFLLVIANPELYEKNKSDKTRLSKKILFTICVFFILNITAFVLQKIGNLFSQNQIFNIIKPEGVKEWTYCLINFFFSSFYEEGVYRFFIPEALLYFTRNCKDKRMVEIDCEILGMILFALGHIYLGILSVINAAIAYFVLRFCFKKTNSLVPGTAAHFLYNVLQLVVSPF